MVLVRSVILFAVLLLISCKQQAPKEHDIRFVAVNEELNNNNPEWLKKGALIYGIIVFYTDGKARMGKPVPCKVIDISKRGVKCQALEKVALFDEFNCFKIGIEKDEIWYDVPQDLFKTKDEAHAFLVDKGLIIVKL